MMNADTSPNSTRKFVILSLGVVVLIATAAWFFFGPSSASVATDATAQKAEQLRKSYGDQPAPESLPPPTGPPTRGARKVSG